MEYILKISKAILDNLDVFFINFSVFCFGYLFFESYKTRKEKLRLETTADQSYITAFYFEGGSPFKPITDEDLATNPNAKIFCSDIEDLGEIEVSREYYKLYREYEQFN